jgi:hypothetical protein
VPHFRELQKDQIALGVQESQAGVLVVCRHHLLVRSSHWLNVPILLGLVLIGVSIYWASPVYQHRPNPQTGSFDPLADMGIWICARHRDCTSTAVRQNQGQKETSKEEKRRGGSHNALPQSTRCADSTWCLGCRRSNQRIGSTFAWDDGIDNFTARYMRESASARRSRRTPLMLKTEKNPGGTPIEVSVLRL